MHSRGPPGGKKERKLSKGLKALHKSRKWPVPTTLVRDFQQVSGMATQTIQVAGSRELNDPFPLKRLPHTEPLKYPTGVWANLLYVPFGFSNPWEGLGFPHLGFEEFRASMACY